MDPAVLGALRQAEELELITTGRLTGRPHSVRLAFAYADGGVWLRTDERPPPADASGIHRRRGREPHPDWLRNLADHPGCEVAVGQARFSAAYGRPAAPGAARRRTVGYRS